MSFPSILQLPVIAYDSAYPNDQATATVTINVNRNLYSPVFTEAQYIANVYDNTGLGVVIKQVNATDRDSAVSLLIQPNEFVKFRILSQPFLLFFFFLLPLADFIMPAFYLCRDWFSTR